MTERFSGIEELIEYVEWQGLTWRFVGDDREVVPAGVPHVAAILRPPRPKHMPKKQWAREFPSWVGRGDTLLEALELAVDRVVVDLNGRPWDPQSVSNGVELEVS